MTCSTLLPCLEGIALDRIVATGDSMVLCLSTVATSAPCPVCQQQAGRVHSHYPRTLTDLPWNHVSVRICLRTRKFFCDNRACPRAIFTEPLLQLVARYARKTRRLQEVFALIGYLLGGKAGARLAVGLGLWVGPDTLLRQVRKRAVPSLSSPAQVRVVGVDDWAFRKGQRYGTVLVDLQQHRLLDLLPDRTSESLAAWLKQVPDLEVLSRDRAGVYAQGARQGAPQAQQVADRWHLLDNLGQALQRLTAQHIPLVRRVAQQIAAMPSPSSTATAPPPRAWRPRSRAGRRRQEQSAQRAATAARVQALRQQGKTVAAIAAEVHLSLRTVARRLQSDPAAVEARPRPRQTDRYDAYLRQRLLAGCRSPTQLFAELQAQGYPGAVSGVNEALARLRATDPQCAQMAAAQRARASVPSGGEVPPHRCVAWWLQGYFTTTQPPVAHQQRAFVQQLCREAPLLHEASDLAQAFVQMVQTRQAADLDVWLQRAAACGCQELRGFAAGLREDLGAVRNALTLPWSNGQTEGQVNRLKMLKRQMYGRANFDLLRARVLPMAQAA